MEKKDIWKVEDKFKRIYKNQQTSERRAAMEDYEQLIAEPNHPWRKSLYSNWTQEDLQYMVVLLRESLR